MPIDLNNYKDVIENSPFPEEEIVEYIQTVAVSFGLIIDREIGLHPVQLCQREKHHENLQNSFNSLESRDNQMAITFREKADNRSYQ